QTKDIDIVVDVNIRSIIRPFFSNNFKIDIEAALKNEKLKNISKINIFGQNAATRFLNDLVSVFNGITKTEKAKETIKKITDTGIQKILFNHLSSNNNKPEIAFSAAGIEK